MDGTPGRASHSLSCSEAGRGKALDPSHQSEEGTRKGREGGQTQGTLQGRLSKATFAIVTLLTTAYLAEGELIPFRRDENTWSIQKKINNFFLNVVSISDFCLSGGTYVEQASTSCLVGAGTPIANIQN